MNLLINAAHSIEEGAVEDNRVALRAREEDEGGRIDVLDTGSGIDLQELVSLIYDARDGDEGAVGHAG